MLTAFDKPPIRSFRILTFTSMFWVKTPALFEEVFKDAWWKIHDVKQTIFLTFDDGPHPDTTPFILDKLRAHNATATFFCTGHAIESHPQLFERIVNEGHTVGNHSYDHLHSWKTNSAVYMADIEKADAVINSKLFRPPYGKLKRNQWLILKRKYQVVMWSVMPHDYKVDLPWEKILNRLKENSGTGDIVVLHENDKSKEHIKKVLPEYLDFLSQKGLEVKRLPNAN